jgi:hypothetical protein
MKQFIKNFLIGLCLAPIAIVIACVIISPIFIMMHVHSECIQGLLLLVYMALLFAAIVSTINKLSKNNKELRDKIKNNYDKSL